MGFLNKWSKDMKKANLLFVLFLLIFFSCKENENIVCPGGSSEKPNYSNPSFGEYTYYLYGECNELGDFINPPEDVYFAYGRILNINGLECTEVELRKEDSDEKKTFFLSITDKWVKILSSCFYPFVPYVSVEKQYCPQIWETLWTSNYNRVNFDTVIGGKCYVPAQVDSLIGMIGVPCNYYFNYKYENIGERFFSVRGSCTPVRAVGTKIIFESIAKISDSKYKFERIPDSIATQLGLKFNYDEFYFDNDRSAYLDKVEMEVFRNEKIGIIFIWVKHKTILGTKYYKYMFQVNIRIIN